MSTEPVESRCDDLTRSPRGILRCSLPSGHPTLHQIDPAGPVERSTTEPVDTVAPSRERVEAYEKALKCDKCYHPGGFLCHRHDPNGRAITDLGCPVAIAAARVEVERVAHLAAHPQDSRPAPDEWLHSHSVGQRAGHPVGTPSHAPSEGVKMSTELEKSESAARWAFERDQELVRRLGDEVDRLTATLDRVRAAQDAFEFTDNFPPLWAEIDRAICDHEGMSHTGVDQTDLLAKAWRCDNCGRTV